MGVYIYIYIYEGGRKFRLCNEFLADKHLLYIRMYV